MSFVEFHQLDGGSLVGLIAYEADPNWTFFPPSREEELVYPRVRTDKKTGSWVVFDPERGLWGAVVRSPEVPYNDCLPPGEIPFLESLRTGDSPQSILTELQERNDETFVNPFQVVLGDRRSEEIVCFHGSFQSKTRTVPSGRYRLTDQKQLTSFEVDQWRGFTSEPDPDSPTDALLESVSPHNIENYCSSDGTRILKNVLVFQWKDELQIRTTNTLDSSPNWKNPLSPVS